MDDQRSALPIYDQETIDEPQDGGTGDGKGLEPENRMDLGPTEKVSAKITDFDLLKVIGKGSFGKVRGCGLGGVWPTRRQDMVELCKSKWLRSSPIVSQQTNSLD